MKKLLKDKLIDCDHLGTIQNTYPQSSPKYTQISLYYLPSDHLYLLHTKAGYKSKSAKSTPAPLGGVILTARDDIEIVSKTKAKDFIKKHFPTDYYIYFKD